MNQLQRLGLFLLVSLAACETFTTAIENKQPLEPLPIYVDWWAATESCSGLSGDFSRVQWFTASSIVGDGRLAAGRWSPPHDIIIVRGYEDEPEVVRHEMLHDLLAGDRHHKHRSWGDCGLLSGG